MYDLACSNDGTYFNVEEAEGLPDGYDPIFDHFDLYPNFFSSLLVCSSCQVSFSFFFLCFGICFSSFHSSSQGPFDGLLVVGIPALFFLRTTTSCWEVVSIEFNFDDIENFLASLARGFSFAFLTTSEVKIQFRPRFFYTLFLIPFLFRAICWFTLHTDCLRWSTILPFVL